MLEISLSESELVVASADFSAGRERRNTQDQSSDDEEQSELYSFSEGTAIHRLISHTMENDSNENDMKQREPILLHGQEYLNQVDALVMQFNEDPKIGWDQMQESKIMSEDPQEIADFFYDNYGVDPDQLGEFLGKGSRGEIMNAFVLLNDFRGLSVADALRHMLRKFKPRGESAIIDRILMAFANAYNRDNPTAFSHQDTAYQIAFALLMLNTSLHNPHAFRKAPELAKSPKHFRKMIIAELCPDENNLSKQTVRDMYHSIQSRPIELIADKYMTIFRDSERSGLLNKKGHGKVKNWNRRLVVLSGHKYIGYALYYFKGGQDRAWRSMIPLNENVKCVLDRKNPQVFIVRHLSNGEYVTAAKRRKDGSIGKDKRKAFEFRCENERQAMYWVSAINVCIERSLDERDNLLSITESSTLRHNAPLIDKDSH